MANLYADKKWAVFREQVIELDGGECVSCGRSRADGVVLQVHHKLYVRGRKPWEYDPSDCETLCRGCHAREHGEIRPDTGWEYVGEDDLGDLFGSCELCDTSIRYVHYVQHEHWEQMGVGSDCCDNLTGTQEAAEYRRRLGRRRRFVASSRWKSDGDQHLIKQDGLRIAIVQGQGGYKLVIDEVQGRKEFEHLLHAQEFVFDLIDSGEAADFIQRRKLRS
ncbi:HNH endonuclease [Pseudomonas sp. 30_B]|uniref:HNH endonuclease n=1 Tax=Pseudomonas sp. 30_B TaxID=2813575 RepID=UPI001A9FB6F3|nr:HNH endonuclease [Pseudomonas sp. 30_B]